MALTRRGRLRKALAEPFPEAWRNLLAEDFAHWHVLAGHEREQLERLIRLLLVDKLWEGSKGFELTDEIRVVISAMASLPILGLDYDYYHRVTSIIVSPTTVVFEGDRHLGGGVFTDEPQRLIGQARFEGPVLIAWDAAREQARDPDQGHNVVYHELAHKLDMLGGSVDGTPPLESHTEYERWIRVCNEEFAALRGGTGGDLLDPYGAENTGEFFAVVTEVFFDRPIRLEREKPELYAVFRGFYRQDPAARERRAGNAPWWAQP
ncbi:MAG: M90 family metallopeptidase [Candidatus Dormibacteria bacterium]|jgi:Mlc titration factor MtfA (ptsG expression regulator)